MELLCKKTIRAVICTRSDALAERLREQLLRWACGECVALSVAHTGDASAWKDESADLLFLDLDSIRPAGLTEARPRGLIVISRDSEHTIRSFRWHPDAFLEPEFDTPALAEALAVCERLWFQGRFILRSPYIRRELLLPLGRVRCIEAAAHGGPQAARDGLPHKAVFAAGRQ